MFWFRREVEAASKANHLDPDLVQAVCEVESAGRTSAYRYEPKFWTKYLKGKPEWAGANPERVSASYGLAQVMFPVAKEHGFRSDPEALFMPQIGVTYGCIHLASLMAWAKNDTDKALSAYNAGKGNAHAPYKNQTYIDKVKAALAKIKVEGVGV